jgi:hypothetical protein
VRSLVRDGSLNHLKVGRMARYIVTTLSPKIQHPAKRAIWRRRSLSGLPRVERQRDGVTRQRTRFWHSSAG